VAKIVSDISICNYSPDGVKENEKMEKGEEIEKVKTQRKTRVKAPGVQITREVLKEPEISSWSHIIELGNTRLVM